MPAVANDKLIPALKLLLLDLRRGVFAFLAAADPYLTRADANVRPPLVAMLERHGRHIEQLEGLLQDLGEVPPMPPIDPSHQYLAYLAFDYLLPNLLEEKIALSRRYEQLLASLGELDPRARQLLAEQMQDHRRDSAVLQKAAKGIKPA